VSFRSADLGCALGAAALMFGLWAGAPGLLGVLEPWDTDYPVYATAALLAGAALGYLSRGALLALFLGAWFGQIVALVALPGHDRSWLFLGVLTTGLGSLVVVAGGAVGGWLRKRASVT
jgi:hypothetical protein